MASNPVINIVIPQGTDFSETFVSTESDGSTSNLFGYSGQSQIRKHYDSSDYTEFSVTIISSTGEVSIALTSGKTSTLTPGRYYYDVVLTSESGSVSRLVEGMALVTPGVTL